MSNQDSSSNRVSDEDLLASAIPIDSGESDPDEPDLEPIEIESGAENLSSSKTILAFGEKKRHEDKFARKPNKTGQGAIHVKTFCTKLRLDAIQNLDQQINEWLDANPDYEVKFVSSSVGSLIGKSVEDALFINVWV